MKNFYNYFGSNFAKYFANCHNLFYFIFCFVLHITVIPQNEDLFILQEKLNFLSQNNFLVAA